MSGASSIPRGAATAPLGFVCTESGGLPKCKSQPTLIGHLPSVPARAPEIGKYRLAGGLARCVRGVFTAVIIGVLILTTVLAFTSDVGAVTYLATMAPWILLLLILLGLRFGGAGWLGAWEIRRNNPNMVSGMRHSISLTYYRVRCGQIESAIQWSAFL